MKAALEQKEVGLQSMRAELHTLEDLIGGRASISKAKLDIATQNAREGQCEAQC